ncbi:hypothetical protein LCGC14_1521670, partial [marine sediment metagenome]
MRVLFLSSELPYPADSGGTIKTGPDRGCVDCTRLDGAGHAQHDVIMLLSIERNRARRATSPSNPV